MKIRFLKESIDDHCRKCKSQKETFEHILSASTIAGIRYLERQNAAPTIIYLELVNLHNIPFDQISPYDLFKPSPVAENEHINIYCDEDILTHKEIVHNRPVIIEIDKGRKKGLLIDVSIPNNNNLTEKHT